jgi:hypothetical protein
VAGSFGAGQGKGFPRSGGSASVESPAAAGAMDAPGPSRPPVVDPRGKSREELIARIPPELCVRCKGGKLLCGLARCPILDSIREKLPAVQLKGKELQGSSPPTLFVGRFGYPAVRVGPMLPPLALPDAARLDDPRGWLGTRSMRDIVAMRASLFRSNHVLRVDEPRRRDPVLEAAQLLAMASQPAEVAVTLRKEAGAGLQPRMDGISAPMGPSLDAERAKVVSNPTVPRKVDALVGDVHARASDAVGELAKGGISGYHIQRVLSAGLLGRESSRRLVPTRWSITATDDILGKQAIARVKGFQQLGEVELYTSEHYGNRFWVLLLPRPWAFEMLERWHAGSAWSRAGSAAAGDWEPWQGRTTYADNVSGAYYAARLSILEHLEARQRQAQPIVYREITDAYLFPLGVWVIRESVRDALQAKGRAFDHLEAAVRTVSMACSAPGWHQQSVLLREARVQRRLSDFTGAA